MNAVKTLKRKYLDDGEKDNPENIDKISLDLRVYVA